MPALAALVWLRVTTQMPVQECNHVCPLWVQAPLYSVSLLRISCGKANALARCRATAGARSHPGRSARAGGGRLPGRSAEAWRRPLRKAALYAFGYSARYADRLRLGPGKGGEQYCQTRSLFEEAMLVFRDPLSLSFSDPDSADEERWITLGEAATGNLLLVVHTWVDIGQDRSLVRIISARMPTRNEARQYREKPLP